MDFSLYCFFLLFFLLSQTDIGLFQTQQSPSVPNHGQIYRTSHLFWSKPRVNSILFWNTIFQTPLSAQGVHVNPTGWGQKKVDCSFTCYAYNPTNQKISQPLKNSYLSPHLHGMSSLTRAHGKVMPFHWQACCMQTRCIKRYWYSCFKNGWPPLLISVQVLNWLCHTIFFSQVAVNDSLSHLLKHAKNHCQLVRNQSDDRSTICGTTVIQLGQEVSFVYKKNH